MWSVLFRADLVFVWVPVAFSSIASHSFSPFLYPNWPCLLKSLSASAAPAASDSGLRSREALSPRTQTHTLYSVKISQPPWAGGGCLRMTTTACMTTKEHVALNTTFKGSSHTHFHKSFHSFCFSLLPWVCIAALSQVVKKQISLVILWIASDSH